jgi:hypothetical protein
MRVIREAGGYSENPYAISIIKKGDGNLARAKQNYAHHCPKGMPV